MYCLYRVTHAIWSELMSNEIYVTDDPWHGTPCNIPILTVIPFVTTILKSIQFCMTHCFAFRVVNLVIEHPVQIWFLMMFH